MPVFQRAPMRRWSPLVFSERSFSYSPPIAPLSVRQTTERPFSGELHSGKWFATWK